MADRREGEGMSDEDAQRRFENIQSLVSNLRSILPPMTEPQAQLVGLYILNAVYLGEGEEFTTFPTLDRKRPFLTLVES
jgi:hypothetical protein